MMGVVYLGDECIGGMYTHNVVDITTTVIDVLKNPVSRYIVDENGVAKTIGGDVTGAFDNAITIVDYGLQYALYNCTGLTGSVSFPNLTSVGTYGLHSIFYGCTGLTGSVSFPKLTSVGTSALYNAFYNCTGITEIHFRADVKATIESQATYSSKFGATNATIYFDL